MVKSNVITGTTKRSESIISVNNKDKISIYEDLAVAGGGSAGTGVSYALKAMPKYVHDQIKRVTATSVGAMISGVYAVKE